MYEALCILEKFRYINQEKEGGLLNILYSFEEEGYDFQVEIASEDFNKIKEKALEIGGLAFTEL